MKLPWKSHECQTIADQAAELERQLRQAQVQIQLMETHLEVVSVWLAQDLSAADQQGVCRIPASRLGNAKLLLDNWLSRRQ